MADSTASSSPSGRAIATENRTVYSTDPFQDNFRSAAANMSIEEVRQFLAPDFQDLTDDEIRTVQSKEWAEKMRPGQQWRAILNERGLYHEYCEIFCREPKGPENEYSRLSQFVKTKAPDLLDKFEEYWSRPRTRPAGGEHSVQI